MNREPRTFGQALALLGAGELFAPGAEQLRELQRLYFDAPRLMEPQVLAGMRGFWNYEPDTVMRDYREWIDRLQDLRDRHYGAGFFSKRPAAALTPVWAIGAGAKEFAGEYSPEELHGKLRRALGLAPEPR